MSITFSTEFDMQRQQYLIRGVIEGAVEKELRKVTAQRDRLRTSQTDRALRERKADMKARKVRAKS